ncbi:tannase/feruloyl esterase family alpha/beta hydrolase [Paraburkholderia sediminicola]|uniref:tannase/feruloyl esterase family alpha/beta hydrolase n=1 Tax=Paraburkholderia sediminicola TaxID=458836 RepID=UPI0038BB8BD1
MISRSICFELCSISAISALLFFGGCSGGVNSIPETAASACGALAGATVASSAIGLPTTGAVINSAVLVAATPALGEYCKVSGSISPIDPAAQDIQFSVSLPSNWNGKALQIGGGGFDGTVPDTVDPTPLLSGPSPLARGYAAFASDSGHQAPDGDNDYAAFALNDEMLRNYAADAVKKTHDAAMSVIALRYGTAPAKTYFIGGSKGGQESMMAFQRWPQDYDGIISEYPIWAFMPQVLSWQRFTRALYENGGTGFLSTGKLTTLQNAELAACDSLDGAADGIISNLGACNFVSSSLRCPGGADTGDNCLSDAQIGTVNTMQSTTNFPYAFNNGITSNPGFNTSTNYAIGGLGAFSVFPSPPNDAALGAMSGYIDAIVRNFIFGNPAANTLSFDPMAPGQYLNRIQELSNIMDASSTDIQPFMGKGKWIIVQGLSDELVASGDSVNYYNSLVAKFGKESVDGFLRFYTIPGFAHAAGSFNASGGLPVLEALEGWVESKNSPGNLVVTDTNAPGRTRPLCLYPMFPKYNGTGDINSAANFDCVSG